MGVKITRQSKCKKAYKNQFFPVTSDHVSLLNLMFARKKGKKKKKKKNGTSCCTFFLLLLVIALRITCIVIDESFLPRFNFIVNIIPILSSK